MMKSRIEKKLKRKENPELAKSIIATKKHKEWVKISNLLSRPSRKTVVMNLDQIDKDSKEGDIILVPGKVLSEGRLTKKIRVVGFSFSEAAKRKLRESKCEFVNIIEEVKNNPKAQGIRVLY